MSAAGSQSDVRNETAADTSRLQRHSRLLAAKLTPPVLPPAHVPRPRLSTLLSPEDARLTLLSGPPGAGKTTLLAEWVAAQTDQRFAWLSVDELDNDRGHFWSYVVPSLQRWEPTVGVEAIDLLSDDEESLTMVESLAADLADVAPPITLIIDDLHRVQARSVLRDLDFLVDHLPESLKMILSTRVDPPLALHRLRGHGQLLELRQSDLQFTEQDAEAFFENFGGVRLGSTEVRLLTERTEGWIVGLQLAALSLRGEENPKASVERFAVRHPTLDDYFLGEVLERQPPYVQEFLLRTSILSELTPSLCDAITERTDSHLLLRTLEAQNLFVLSNDEPRNSYRYHHLFAELLQTEFRARNREAWRHAHRRAADWYSAAGRPMQALEHLLAGQFDDEALDLLIDNTVTLWDVGRGMTMSMWLDRFPAGFFDVRPKRMLDLATALVLGGNYAEAGRCLEQVESVLSSSEQHDTVQRARLAGVRSLWAMFQGEGVLSVDWMERAIDSYRPDADDGYISRFPYALGRSWVWLANAEAAWAALRRNYDLPPVPESIVRFYMPMAMALIRFLEGYLQEAERLSDEALGYVNLSGPDQPELNEARLTRAGVLFERNQLEESEREFETAQRVAETHSQVPAVVIASLGLARIWAVSGRLDEAFDLIATCRHANRPLALPEPFASRIDDAEARMLLDRRALQEAGQLIGRLPTSIDSSFLRARLALATGDRKQASNLLAAMEEDLTTPRRRLEWQLLDARSRSASSEVSLRAAVEFAASEGFIRCFVDQGDELLLLLREQSRVGPAWYVRTVLAAFEASSPTASPGGASLVDPLSERELVVLSYLPSWVPSNEIAAELYISINTLKSHLRSIYRKLGASSRREAVSQARARGLL